MKNISDLWKNIVAVKSKLPKYSWNEAELYPTTFVESIKWKTSSILEWYLYRSHLIWNHSVSNSEIIDIYDSIEFINKDLEEKWLDYCINIIEHLKDDNWEIFIKDLWYSIVENKKFFSVYDLMPDSYYIDPNKKQKSRFKDFKNIVKELDLNKTFIITNIFEQIALLHANNYVVGSLDLWEKVVGHPTLSLFLYRLKSKNWDLKQKIFIHDIHNLKKLDNPDNFTYIKHCVSDLKDLSLDIIRFFKWVWIPHWWFMSYSKVLRKLNPSLYNIIYHSFLRDPKLEIEIRALEWISSENKKELKKSRNVIDKLWSFNKKNINYINTISSLDDIFYIWSNKNKINRFFDSIDSNNLEIIIDFDYTLTYVWSDNSFNIAYLDDFNVSKNYNWKFIFRHWSIAFIKLLLNKGYDIKIYSLWFKDIIYKSLLDVWIEFNYDNIFWNSFDDIKFSKNEILLNINDKKNRLVIWDNINDFEWIEYSENDLRIWLLNENHVNLRKDVKKYFMKNMDLFFISDKSSFIWLYEIFKYKID